MGGEGLTQATKVAILNANYLAARLKGAYDVLFTGAKGRVAHECILDTRPFAEAGSDRGRHRQAPDGSRVSRADHELAGGGHADDRTDRERAQGGTGPFRDRDAGDPGGRWRTSRPERSPWKSPLRLAPHTMEDLVRDWDRAYSREEGCFPPGAFRVDKYWPPVNRVDNAYGDRNLVCTCPPLEEYLDAAE
jgi:glycine dehydrogenase